jgi:DNA-binding CsgD family transcriptional regulator
MLLAITYRHPELLLDATPVDTRPLFSQSRTYNPSFPLAQIGIIPPENPFIKRIPTFTATDVVIVASQESLRIAALISDQSPLPITEQPPFGEGRVILSVDSQVVTQSEQLIYVKTDEHVAAALGGLTPRELEVIRLLGQPGTTKAIADTLMMSENTAKTHIRNAIHKIGAKGQTHAFAKAIRAGLDISQLDL